VKREGLPLLVLALVPLPARADEFVADLHVDLPYQVQFHGRPVDLGRPGGDVSAATLAAGGVRLLVLSLYLPSDLATGARVRPHTLSQLLALTDTAERIVRENPEVFGPGRTQAVFGVEGSDALANDLDRIPALVRRGVVLFGPVHARHNVLADSATDRHPSRGGLTALGERFVRAVYAAGALVDVSHASDEAFEDVARIAREMQRPLVASHSNARAVTDHPRNLTDEELRTVAASGGMVGLNFHSAFLRGDGRRATVQDVVRHALHMRAVMGAGHLAIGSDLDGEIRPARGLETHAGIPGLAAALRQAGFPLAEITALLGVTAAGLLGDRFLPHNQSRSNHFWVPLRIEPAPRVRPAPPLGGIIFPQCPPRSK
jgi:membrane dipeptidase